MVRLSSTPHATPDSIIKQTSSGNGKALKSVKNLKLKKPFRHSVMYSFQHRVKKAQKSVEQFINQSASQRIVFRAMKLDGVADMRVKRSAVYAFHDAAEAITKEIFRNAYTETLLSNRSKLNAVRVVNSIKVWSNYRDYGLTAEIEKLSNELDKRPIDHPKKQIVGVKSNKTETIEQVEEENTIE